jgi:dTDP-glucose pyrophosphorylase
MREAMKDWHNILVPSKATIVEALQVLDSGSLQIVLVVDDNKRLLGTVTDGDVRAGILKGVSLDEPVDRIMCPNPVTARLSDADETILATMRARDILQIPILDEAGRIIGLRNLKDFLAPQERPNLVVLMAGGLGTRLMPLTEDCPKPLLRVGGKPILEIILENFIRHGFRRFSIAVNYKAEMVERHFGDGSAFGARIEYLREPDRLGTAGALTLLPERPVEPFFVMNGDLLTNLNFGHLLAFHKEREARATMCVRQYDFQVPYGVVQTEEDRLLGIDEKPVHRFFVNAGIYVFNPQVLDLVPPQAFFDMNELFSALIASGQEAVAFPLREYWLDIGQMQDYLQANGDYEKHFDSMR